MQVPSKLLECVCFVRGERNGSHWQGTAFFLAVPLDVDDRAAIYVVTAGHCVQPLDYEEEGPFERISLRLNNTSGGSEWIETDPAAWRLHATADVAVLPFAPPQDRFEYKYYPAHGGATEEFVRDGGLGPGDEVLVTGLLVHHPGKTRILPIVRVGNIAAFPAEPIHLATGPERSILVEARSLGGLSGSPAFLHLPDWRRDAEGALRVLQSTENWNLGGPNFLLGLVHGFYPTTENDPDRIGADEPLNTGISVIVPLEKILDVIDCPEYVEVRNALKNQIQDKTNPIPSAVLSVPPSEPLHDRALAGPGPPSGFTRTELIRDGFVGFVRFPELRERLDDVPATGGVYVVVRTTNQPPAFLDSNPGGRFKGRDPTASCEVLRSKWVSGAEIIYIGKGDNLRRRIKQYAEFGAGRPVGHWGGRYIWQLADADALLVAWIESVPPDTAAITEARLVGEFKATHGRLPFANIADPSARSSV